MKTPTIDADPCLPGEDRCRHQMLIFGGTSTCAWCRGLADVPDEAPSEDVTDAPVRWVHPENRCQCVECDEWIGINGWCTWTAQGVMCRPCADQAA